MEGGISSFILLRKPHVKIHINQQVFSNIVSVNQNPALTFLPTNIDFKMKFSKYDGPMWPREVKPSLDKLPIEIQWQFRWTWS